MGEPFIVFNEASKIDPEVWEILRRRRVSKRKWKEEDYRKVTEKAVQVLRDPSNPGVDEVMNVVYEKFEQSYRNDYTVHEMEGLIVSWMRRSKV